jgi:hypothetical protein
MALTVPCLVKFRQISGSDCWLRWNYSVWRDFSRHFKGPLLLLEALSTGRSVFIWIGNTSFVMCDNLNQSVPIQITETCHISKVPWNWTTKHLIPIWTPLLKLSSLLTWYYTSLQTMAHQQASLDCYLLEFQPLSDMNTDQESPNFFTSGQFGQ